MKRHLDHTLSLVAARRVPLLLRLLILCVIPHPGLPGAEAKDIAVEGESESEILGYTSPFGPDRIRFSATFSGCSFKMELSGPVALPGSRTLLADDGTNYYSFVPGAGGTYSEAGVSKSYQNAAPIQKSGTLYPIRHGTAVWLLFGSRCGLPSGAGDIDGTALGLVTPGSDMEFVYQRVDDTERNAFGPSKVRIFRKLERPTTGFTNLLAAELEVTKSDRHDGQAFPRLAEFRLILQNPGETSFKVRSTFRVSIASFRTPASVGDLRPIIGQSTEISDLRLGDRPSIYVSDEWKTEAEVRQLELSAYQKTPKRGIRPNLSSRPIGRWIWISGVAALVISLFIWLARRGLRSDTPGNG